MASSSLVLSHHSPLLVLMQRVLLQYVVWWKWHLAPNRKPSTFLQKQCFFPTPAKHLQHLHSNTFKDVTADQRNRNALFCSHKMDDTDVGVKSNFWCPRKIICWSWCFRSGAFFSRIKLDMRQMIPREDFQKSQLGPSHIVLQSVEKCLFT